MAPLVSVLDWLGGLDHYRLAGYLCHHAQVRWILSYDDHPDLVEDENLYAATQTAPSPTDAYRQGARQWHITKRLVDLRYSASATRAHRGKREELLITTLPASSVPLDDRFRAYPPDRRG